MHASVRRVQLAEVRYPGYTDDTVNVLDECLHRKVSDAERRVTRWVAIAT